MMSDPNLTKNKVRALVETARKSCKGTIPEIIDYGKAENPYKARFVQDWMAQLVKVQLMQPYICITELVDHMVSATKKVMRGTKYEGKELFFHDALSLMTARETVRWMKEKNIYKHWVVPVLGCNDQVGENKNCYANRPVGNSPELMCLDMSLNKDVQESLQMHVTMTQKLDKNDPRPFSNASPNEIVKSI